MICKSWGILERKIMEKILGVQDLAGLHAFDVWKWLWSLLKINCGTLTGMTIKVPE
jgi:hypothetical protein